MDYQSAYNDLGAAYDPQISQINTQVAELAPQQQAQQSALDQAKVNAFRDISSGANSKGVLFSGVPIDQQAQYVGTKYLPAYANLQASFNNQKNTLLGQINSLNSERVKTAQGNVATYVKNKADADYKQQQLELSAQRNQIALAAANKPSGGMTAKQTADAAAIQAQQGAVQKLGGALSKVTGSDGYVSPNDYKAALREWNAAGYSAKDFHDYFAGYRNPGNGYYGV